MCRCCPKRGGQRSTCKSHFSLSTTGPLGLNPSCPAGSTHLPPQPALAYVLLLGASHCGCFTVYICVCARVSAWVCGHHGASMWYARSPGPEDRWPLVTVCHCVTGGHHTQVLEPAPWLIIATVTSFYVLDTVSLRSSGQPQTPSAPVSAS